MDAFRIVRRYCTPGICFLAACAAPSAKPTTTPRPNGLIAKAEDPTPKERSRTNTELDALAVFDRMVAMVRRYHLFAPQTEKNLGKSWERDLPRLRAEFASASDKDALMVALWHLGNSLHDVHCQFRAKDRGDRLKLGLRAGVERTGEGHEFYVERVTDPTLRDRIEPGDIVESVDGVPAERLVDEHDLVSNMNSKDSIALQVAHYLAARRTSTTHVRAGSPSSWALRSRQGGRKTVTLTWQKGSNSDDTDFALDYASKDCVNADPKEYGPGYTLAMRGYRVCIYTSTKPTYRDYPIVRQVSFRYDETQHGPLVDFDLISRTLASSKPRGVILDLQDNGGGINPNLFIEWWTDKPYTDTETRMLLDAALLRDEHGAAHISNMTDAVEAWYASELKTRAAIPPGSEATGRRLSSARPFMCKPETCTWENHYTPKRRVTKAPVALLLGPGCASSCDAFAWHFDKEDIGPIVGRGSMAGFTTHRARFDVTTGDGQPVLGTIDFAISYDTPPRGTESIEGVPVNIDVPIARTFENHDHYDRLLVDSAIRALTKMK